jgi:transposase InsO family protein
MPWKETNAMDERMRLVMLVEDGETVSEAARQCGVSRVAAYKWLERHTCAGAMGLQDRSRAPHCHPNAVPEELAERIVALRAQRPTWGPVKLLHWLQAHEGRYPWPCASTIGVLLKERGLTVARKRRRQLGRYSEPLGHCDAPNRVWCADFKGWFLTGDQRRCDPLTISDGFSRYLLRCQALSHPTHEAVRPVFDAAFREYGLPTSIRTDNGTPFAGTRGLALSRLSVWWIKLGITPERIQPGKPQQNGRHERMHRTLKAETLCPPAQSMREQQRRFDRFQRDYNEERPHQALGHQTPASCYTVSARRYTSRLKTPDYPHEWIVRYVYDKGCFYWKHHLIFLSSALDNEYIALAPTPLEGYMSIYFGHARIAYLEVASGRICIALPKTTPQLEGALAQ